METISGPYTVFMEMLSPVYHAELISVKTLREASEVVRSWLMGGNPEREYLGVSQTGLHCGRVTQSLSGVEVARVSYNGRVCEPGNFPAIEITDLD